MYASFIIVQFVERVERWILSVIDYSAYVCMYEARVVIRLTMMVFNGIEELNLGYCVRVCDGVLQKNVNKSENLTRRL